MITLERLSKTYARAASPAVENLSLEVADGGIFGFLGPNGAGKTTTIKMLTGALVPTAGRACIDGFDLTTQPIDAKSRFGYVGDNPELFTRLRAREFLNFVADVYRVPDDLRASRIAQLSERLGIAGVLSASVGSFSRGMKQKLCIVASLVHDPGTWILDEPLVGLDPEAAFELKALMRERAASGGCVFFSTHVMEVAEKLCDRIGIIDRGRLVFTGNLAELRALRAAPSSPADPAAPSTAGQSISGLRSGANPGTSALSGSPESLETLFLSLIESDRSEEPGKAAPRTQSTGTRSSDPKANQNADTDAIPTADPEAASASGTPAWRRLFRPGKKS